jgi:hypothetical protein
LRAFPGPLVKDSYWRWPKNGRAGSAIDFFMRVLGLSFHDAMRQITGTSSHTHPPLASWRYDASSAAHRAKADNPSLTMPVWSSAKPPPQGGPP